MKVGDIVRYLNATGGGVITRIEGQMAYVEEDGFETPVLSRELVVVAPAGHQPSSGARLMFDQSAYDLGKAPSPKNQTKKEAPDMQTIGQAPAPEVIEPAPETDYGNKLSLTLAFEPSDAKRLSESTFSAVLVNDSNYYVTFAFSRKGYDDREWTLVYAGTAAPNELIDLAVLDHQQLPQMERIALQGVAYKKDKGFELKNPVAIEKRLDITKFHKFHCFRPGIYFDTPVLEFPIVSNDTPSGKSSPSAHELAALEGSVAKAGLKNADRKDKNNKKGNNGKVSPFKLLEPIEVDLHINQLTDTTAGLSNSDMLALQLDTVRKVMNEHRRRIGQKIIFIHGKGEGVLRNAVIKLLHKEFPKAEIQDASFREYGFGASLVTIH